MTDKSDDNNNNDNNKEKEVDNKLKIVVDTFSSGTFDNSNKLFDDSFESKITECPEFQAMFEHKMWDIYKIILDKCVGDKEVDFTIIDPPVKSISRHPLMLIFFYYYKNYYYFLIFNHKFNLC